MDDRVEPGHDERVGGQFRQQGQQIVALRALPRLGSALARGLVHHAQQREQGRALVVQLDPEFRDGAAVAQRPAGVGCALDRAGLLAVDAGGIDRDRAVLQRSEEVQHVGEADHLQLAHHLGSEFRVLRCSGVHGRQPADVLGQLELGDA